jgi:hypothetical protein
MRRVSSGRRVGVKGGGASGFFSGQGLCAGAGLRYRLRSHARSVEEDVAMMSNCSLYSLRPLDPAFDPAYQDGPPPHPHPTNHSGEIVIDWPIALIPYALAHSSTISIEALEDEIEREARREERSPG